jgi:hypothetical protein
LAVQAIRSNPKLSCRAAAKIYNVSRTTLSGRLGGQQPNCNIRPPRIRLSINEEQVIVQYILDLDARSYPPRVSGVKDMANRLLRERDASRVGKNWVTNFVKRQPELRTRFNRRIDYQRVKYEDPDAYRTWFRLVQNVVAKYGIQDRDIYNFDETGFLMG